MLKFIEKSNTKFISFLILSFAFSSFASLDCENAFKDIEEERSMSYEALDILYKAKANDSQGRDKYNAGFMYERGNHGVEQKYEKAILWYEEAAKQNHPVAIYRLGKMYERGKGGLDKDLKKAYDFYKLSADLGYARAQYDYAYMNEIGRGSIDKNPSEAYKYYKLAAINGNKIAQFRLAEMLKKGVKDVVEQKWEEADIWYKRSVDQGYAPAKIARARMYETLIEDLATAIPLYEELAKKGVLQAMYRLGRIHHRKEDWKTAIDWYEIAAKKGHVKSKYRLAEIHEKVDKDLEKAYQLQLELANSGYIKSQYEVARMNETAIGTPQDMDTAIKWYKIVANNAINDVHYKDYYKASLRLATIYRFGKETIGVNLEDAVYWYKRALEQGSSEAQIQLNKINEKVLATIEKNLAERAVEQEEKTAEQQERVDEQTERAVEQEEKTTEQQERVDEQTEKTAEQEERTVEQQVAP